MDCVNYSLSGFFICFIYMELAVKPLLSLFINICLLRAKPQDVPASNTLMLLVMVIAVVSGMFGAGSLQGGVVAALMVGLLDVSLTLILLRLFLTMLGLSSRLMQTATALFGTGVILNLLSLPLLWLINTSEEHSANQSLGGLLYLLLLGWSLVIMGHILRHSFKLHFSVGLLMAIGYFMLVNSLAQMLLPAG